MGRAKMAGRKDGQRARPHRGLAWALLSATALQAGGAHVASAQEQGVIQLDAITVTARKRVESDQNVPVSTSVLTADRIAGISPVQSNQDLARSVPNFTFVDLGGQSANAANIRGVGSFSPISADDTSVVFYVDEAPLSVYGIAPSLLDTERVEVLRGPQGTLFGRNSQGGAVNIVSRLPSFARSFEARAEIGSSRYGLGEIIANAPLVDNVLAGRLAMRYSTFGGDIPNIVAGGHDGAVRIGAARGSLLFTPGDRTEAVLSFSYNRQEDTTPRFLLRDITGFPVSAVDPRTRVEAQAYGVNLRVKQEFDAFTLHSVTSAQRTTSTQVLDLTDGLVFSRVTGLAAAFFSRPYADVATIDLRETILQQEFRLTSPDGGPIAWTLGVNAFHSDLAAERLGRAVTPAFVSINGLQSNAFATTSLAAFGEVTVPVGEKLKASFGLRGTHERKEASYLFNGLGLPGVVRAFANSDSLSDNFMTGRAALSYEWSKDVMTYASLSRGYVTGGFPTIAVNSYLGKPEAPFAASTSWTYETGFKAKLFDDRLDLKASLFYNDVKNGHLVVFNPVAAVFSVATLDYTSYGGEIEASAKLAPWLEALGGVGYTHARLHNVPAGSLTGARSGNNVPNVPAWTGNLGLQARLPASLIGLPGELTGRIAYQYVGSRAVDAANTFDLKAYGLLNAKLGWEREGFSVYGFANNIFDTRYQSWGQSFGTVATVRVGQGRLVGIGASARF